MTALVRQEVRSCPLYKLLTSHYWPIVEFHRFSTQMDIRVLSKVNEAMEPLAFHRVIALLRTDRNHEQELVLPRFLYFPNHGQYRHWVPVSSPRSIHFYMSF